MRITKKFHFYAAHRNQHLADKCYNIHGHQYQVEATFLVPPRDPHSGVTTVFDRFDEIDMWLKLHYDHAMLIDRADPLLDYLIEFQKDQHRKLRLVIMPRATSVENLAYHLFSQIRQKGFALQELVIQETTTSIVRYTRDDYEQDCRDFVEDPI